MQVPHYPGVCGMNKAYIAALIRRANKFGFHLQFYRDDFPELKKKLTRQRKRSFWEVVRNFTDTEPVADEFRRHPRNILTHKYSNSVASYDSA